jgi:hypothetical protein
MFMKQFFAVGLRLSCLVACALVFGHLSVSLADLDSEAASPNNVASATAAMLLPDDLIAQIINLKNSVTTITSPEELSCIMGKIDDLERQLALLQGSLQPPIPSLPPSPPEPSLPVDPAQADLMQKIIGLKNAMAAATLPEEQGAIMRQIDDLNQQLSLLQAASQPPLDPIPPKPEPPPSDPNQTELIDQIIGLKNLMTTTTTPEEHAAIMQKIDVLTQQLILLQNSTPSQPALNVIPPAKTDAGTNPGPAAATGAMASNKLWIVNNSRPVSAKPQGNLVTITWNGGPGIRLQMSITVGNAGWQDVPNTEGQSSVDLPMSNTGTFFRIIRK